MITFVSGGARSGKSSFAEQYILQRAVHPVYLATARPSDEEMETRIRHHQESRSSRFVTIETGFHIKKALLQMEENSAGLLDCLTVWLGEALFTEEMAEENIMDEAAEWGRIISENRLHITIVSNDVNEGGLPEDLSVQEYVKVLERLHRFFIGQAETVIQVRGGRPKVWKGEIGP